MGLVKRYDEINTPAGMDLAKLAHVARLQRNIKKRAAEVDSMLKGLEEVKIIEEKVIVDGKLVLLFSVDGMDEGVAIDMADIISGAMTREDGYKAIAKNVQRLMQ